MGVHHIMMVVGSILVAEKSNHHVIKPYLSQSSSKQKVLELDYVICHIVSRLTNLVMSWSQDWPGMQGMVGTSMITIGNNWCDNRSLAKYRTVWYGFLGSRNNRANLGSPGSTQPNSEFAAGCNFVALVVDLILNRFLWN